MLVAYFGLKRDDNKRMKTNKLLSTGSRILVNKGYRILKQVYRKLDDRSIEVLMDEEVGKDLKTNKKAILYVGIRYDYSHKNWGLSFEHYNFYHTLLNMDYSLIYFDYDRIMEKYGDEKMCQMLREAVYYYHPDILFYFHFYDWIDHNILKEISDELPTKTIIWQSDDHFQYEETRPVWELFNLVVTTDRKGYEKRKGEGFNNVLLSQYGCNHFLYKNLNLPRIYDVSFVGRCYGDRWEFIDTLRRNDIDITTFGQGWKNSDRVSQAELIRIYNQSKISLDISVASRGDRIQIKGRDFEAPGCGSLLLTQDTKEITEYFIPGEEVITYQDANDAAEKIKYYLANKDVRERIAQKGYERTLTEHTYQKRLLDIFEFA